jgi:hypothetical protein
MHEIILKEKTNIEFFKKLTVFNNQIKKEPLRFNGCKNIDHVFGRLKTSTKNKHFIPHYMLGTHKWIYSYSSIQ